MLDDQDLRLRAWMALAWPYLDTYPTHDEWIESARDLAATGLPPETLYRLQQAFVAPVLRGQGYYGRWIGLVASLDDPATKAIEGRWQSGDWGKPLGLFRRFFWWSTTGDFWARVGALNGW